MYDIIIVGAGPAGTTLARLLGDSYKILLLDKRDMRSESAFSHATEKCCGGLLDPSAQDALATMHIGIPKSIVEDPQTFVVRAIDFDNHMERYYPRRYVNINRTAFDRYLLDLAMEKPGVNFAEQKLLQDFTQSDGYVRAKILDKQTGKTEYATGKILVGADGASSIVRQKLTERYLVPVSGDLVSGAPREYTCLQEHYRVTPEQQIPYYGAIFDRYVTDFYSWLIPKDDRLILGSAIPSGENVRLRFAKLKAELLEKGFPISEPIYQSGSKLMRPRPFGSVLSGRERVFLIGEAAGLISPSSAEGISYAIRSGMLLAKVLEEPGKKGRRAAYEKALSGLKREITLKSGKSPIMYNPFLRGLVFRTKALSIETEEI